MHQATLRYRYLPQTQVRLYMNLAFRLCTVRFGLSRAATFDAEIYGDCERIQRGPSLATISYGISPYGIVSG